jgi:hypothetical protein
LRCFGLPLADPTRTAVRLCTRCQHAQYS